MCGNINMHSFELLKSKEFFPYDCECVCKQIRGRERETKIQTLRFIKGKYSLLNPACAHRVYCVNECVYLYVG